MKKYILLKVAAFIIIGMTCFNYPNLAAQVYRYDYYQNNWLSWFDTEDYDVRYEGKIEFTDDDKDVKSISAGGYLIIKIRTFGVPRSVEMRSDNNGNLKKEYFVGGKSINFEPEGKKWLSEILIDVIRDTGIGCDTRTKRIYEKRGIEAILNDIEQNSSDFISSKYYTELLSFKDLKPEEYSKIFNSIANHISSDFEKAQILKKIQPQIMENEGVSASFYRAAESIDSDFEKSQLLQLLSNNSTIKDKQLDFFMQVVRNIDSDFEKSQVLKSLIPSASINENTIKIYMSEVRNIDSDFEKGQVLNTYLQKKNCGNNSIADILSVLASFDSDFEKANILKKIAPKIDNNTRLLSLFEEVFNTLSSDFEKSGVLISLIKIPTIDDNMLNTVLNMTKTLDSDFEKSNVLTKIAPKISTSSAELKNKYRDIAKTISSDSDYGKVLRAID
jgi:hypothetical protein